MNHPALKHAVLSVAIVLALALPAFPTAGIGLHYGYDVSLSMPDKIGEQASFSDLTLDAT